jgi:AraC-like DNA-binding protein
LYSISEVEWNEFLTEFGLQPKLSAGISVLANDAQSPDDFVRIYQFLVNELDSRNEALFRAGCYMRDEGYGLSDVIAILAPVHANQQPTHQHKPETYSQRRAEAERTIHSVFSKPARPRKRQSAKRADASYLPNALREALLKAQGGTAFLRVYEGLLLSGKSAGDTITEREILELLSPNGIGRPSVRKALNFAIAPALRNPPYAIADLSILDMPTKTCVFVQATNDDKTPGRPAQRYIIPEIAYLCKLVHVENIGSDPMTLADMQSPATYCAALNRELIKRRPGKYSQAWLGSRLNMSERTLQRYLKRENIRSRQLLEEIRIDRTNLNQIPRKFSGKRAGYDMQPYFLQDEQGKRYPPQPEIAKKLLNQNHSVWLMKRSVKIYWYDRKPLPIVQEQQEIKAT